MTGLLRSSARVLTVSALVIGSLPIGGVVHADDTRTDTSLAGFKVLVEASPLRVLVDDPKLEVPHDPGTAVVEADPNYTLASVAAGPNSRAISSKLWPGNLFGEGLAQIPPAQSPVHPPYPIKGEARYPDKPYDTTDFEGGSMSGAHAHGLEATANADGTPAPKSGQLTVGTVSSVAHAVVDEKDNAIGTGFSAVKDVDILAGTVHIGSVTTSISSTANGSKASTTGTTTVAGLTIAGQAFTVDDKGLHAAGSGNALPGLGTPAEVYEKLGISATLLDQVTNKPTNGAGRTAGGLVIKVDTGPLRAQLSPVTTVVNPVLNNLISQLPKDVKSNLYYFVKATPNITFVFAEANTTSAATLPIKFDPPDFGGGFPPILPGGGDPGSPSIPGTGTAVIPGITPVDPGGVADPPTFADGTPAGPTVQLPSSNAAATYAGGKGVGAVWLLGALVGSGLVGWLLTRFLGLAGGALGLGCRLGAPTSVPNLRSVTA